MKIRVLGSAAGGGVPQWNCACDNCAASRGGRLPARSVAAIAVSGGDDRYVLVNAGCDIGRQIQATPELAPRNGRASPIVSLLLTDANIDHTAGLLEFRQAERLQICSTALVKQTLCAGPMFAQFARGNKQWRTFDAARTRVRVDVEPAPLLEIWAIATQGFQPAYAGGSAELGASVAYVFEHGGARLVYAPIFSRVDVDLKAELERADAVLLDGTCWSDDEMIALGLGTRSSRAMGHAPIDGADGSLAAVTSLRARHRYYTHVNNTNPILDPASAQAQTLARAGWSVASDGLEITIDGDRRD
jgi:pyrroloquinoline quinone biosynthesis protein B